VLHGGREVFRQAKSLLPTYDIFDEARYFEPAPQLTAWEHPKGCRVAIGICEDFWAEDGVHEGRGRSLYSRNPVEDARKAGAQLLLSLSASPYEWQKQGRRERIHREIARSLQVPLVYVNQVGANDEALFDGASFYCDARGEFLARLPVFQEGFACETISIKNANEGASYSQARASDEGQTQAAGRAESDELETLRLGLVRGIRDYWSRTGFRSAVLGLSGGIDSAVIAVLAAEALGPERVLGVAMPSSYSSPSSLKDAEELARGLAIRFQVQPIKFHFSTFARELGTAVGGSLAPLAQENLQSRLRGLILMSLSNHYGALVLTTGNKSEIATGYCTLYGDMCGALAPLGDVLKTRVYALARHLNASWQARGKSAPIPESSIVKAPSAELRPGQTDQDSLPPYNELDELLARYLEDGESVGTLVRDLDSRVKAGWVRDILTLVERQEFKRRQAAPVLKTTKRAFGMGRRMPIAKRWSI
jgi:NAD+ synthetase